MSFKNLSCEIHCDQTCGELDAMKGNGMLGHGYFVVRIILKNTKIPRKHDAFLI